MVLRNKSDNPKNPSGEDPLDNVENYEIINYVNDLSLQNVEVLMTSDQNGKYTNAYTYGLDRISVDNLSVANNVKTDPLYYLYDGRGSVSDVINTNGQVRDKYNYEAYGVTYHGGQLGSSDTHYENYYSYNGEDTNRFSGLQNLRARYYEPETGSFLTRDSYMGSIMEPLSLNRYTYGQNNPMMNTDPSGHWPQWLKNLGKNITKTASNIISGVKNIVSNVKSFVSKAVTTARNTVKSRVNSIRKTVRKGITNVKTSAEKKIDYAKASVRDTVQKVKQLSKPMITTRNYANEIVRNTIESVKKTCEGAQYVASKAYEYKEQILDGVQLGLDIVGFVPVIGDILDGVNGVISLARGNYGDAALSLAAMVPFVGGAATAAKFAKKASKAIDVVKAADNSLDVINSGKRVLNTSENISNTSIISMNLQLFASKKADDVVGTIGKNVDDVGKGVSKGIDGVRNPEIVLPSKPHTNGTQGHWETILDEVDIMKNSGDYKKVYVNKGLSNEIPGAKPNRRPDVMGVKHDGTIDQVEVPSKTDDPLALRNRMKDNQKIIGDRAGSIKVRPINK